MVTSCYSCVHHGWMVAYHRVCSCISLAPQTMFKVLQYIAKSGTGSMIVYSDCHILMDTFCMWGPKMISIGNGTNFHSVAIGMGLHCEIMLHIFTWQAYGPFRRSLRKCCSTSVTLMFHQKLFLARKIQKIAGGQSWSWGILHKRSSDKLHTAMVV